MKKREEKGVVAAEEMRKMKLDQDVRKIKRTIFEQTAKMKSNKSQHRVTHSPLTEIIESEHEYANSSYHSAN